MREGDKIFCLFNDKNYCILNKNKKASITEREIKYVTEVFPKKKITIKKKTESVSSSFFFIEMDLTSHDTQGKSDKILTVNSVISSN